MVVFSEGHALSRQEAQILRGCLLIFCVTAVFLLIFPEGCLAGQKRSLKNLWIPV